jgi:hypothetical protein
MKIQVDVGEFGEAFQLSVGADDWKLHEWTKRYARLLESSRAAAWQQLVSACAHTNDPNVRAAMALFGSYAAQVESLQNIRGEENHAENEEDDNADP